VIRRGFWLVAGAALGVSGYRRAARLARSITGTPEQRGALLGDRAAVLGRAGDDRGQRAQISRGGGTLAFLRDVHEGMTDYLDRHPPRSGPTLGSQRERRQLPGRAGGPGSGQGSQRAKGGR
jgi:hypothetical protein